jgi:hypothetical protein
VVTTGPALQTKNVDSRDIEALSSEELGSQMDVDAGQSSRNWAVPLGILRIFLEGHRCDIRDRRFRFEIDSVDGQPAGTLLEMCIRCLWMCLTGKPALVSWSAIEKHPA